MSKERAAMRPQDYLSRSPQEQWEIDKQLGILDWNPQSDADTQEAWTTADFPEEKAAMSGYTPDPTPPTPSKQDEITEQVIRLLDGQNWSDKPLDRNLIAMSVRATLSLMGHN